MKIQYCEENVHLKEGKLFNDLQFREDTTEIRVIVKILQEIKGPDLAFLS